VLVDPARLLAALGLPADADVDFEPLGAAPGSAEGVVVRAPGQEQRVVLLRRSIEPEGAENNIAVLERLIALGYAQAPRLLAVVDGVAVEEALPGVSALGLLPPDGSCEAAIDALAALHLLPVREGLRWGQSPGDVFPAEDLPLHRLGFAGRERDAARPHLSAAREALLASPFGFVHGDATAANVVLLPNAAWLTNFEGAGYGSQLIDVVSFLLTAGLYPEQRRQLAERYAAARSLPPTETADLVDLAGLLWVLGEQLHLPRRLIEAYGDDIASEALQTIAGRINRGLQEPAGAHPLAVAIRAALWP
jgi:hypothetical protein